jgi:peptide subunit release factor 1 (eRF1)
MAAHPGLSCRYRSRRRGALDLSHGAAGGGAGPGTVGTAIAIASGMANPASASVTPLRDQLEALAAFEPVDLPVLSLYLNLAPDQHGRDRFDPFVRKTFADRVRSLRPRSKERESFERDTERIGRYLEEIDRSANALALFACAGANDFFEALPLDAPIEQHWLFVGAVPHLYPLARLIDQHPRYAALVLDTSSARIFVFGLSRIERAREVTSDKTRRSRVGGMSQARYQRHADNMHLQHVKEVIDTLDAIVTTEQIAQIVVAGDEVAVPILRDQLPKHLAEKLVDVIRLERGADERQILEATLQLLKGKDATTDAERVEELMTQWKSGGLGVAGPEATLKALSMGQVDQLLISASSATLKPVQHLPEGSTPGPVHVDTTAPEASIDPERAKLAGELVTRAEQTGATVRFIENVDLLAAVGGVGALLRFRI